MNPIGNALAGKRVLVTGGTGFIGTRLAEKLVLECKADVRVLVRNFARAPRIARFPVEMVPGDVTRPDDIKQAVHGCEVVFHCAVSTEGSKEVWYMVNVGGTKNVLEAALQAGVKRVVHLSTLMVYGATPDGDLDETAPRHALGDLYSQTKLESEKIAFNYFQRYSLPVVIIQPTGVYGPFALTYCVNVIQQLKTERVILVNGGDGLLNLVYIDDVVSAILLAAVKEQAVGEAFLISGEHPVTWRDFYSRFERILGISGTVSMSVAEAEAYYRKKRRLKGVLRETLRILREEPVICKRILRTREVAALKRILRSLLPEQIRQSMKRRIKSNGRKNRPQNAPKDKKLIRPISPWALSFYASKTRIRIDKAKRMLGYQPAFDFESGMRLTEQWVRWANLLDG